MGRPAVCVTVCAAVFDDDGRMTMAERSSTVKLERDARPGQVTLAYRDALRNASDRLDLMLTAGHGGAQPSARPHAGHHAEPFG